jgi:YVTN family beta-propeller protein
MAVFQSCRCDRAVSRFVILAFALVAVASATAGAAHAATVAATISLPKGASAVTSGFGSIWSANADSKTISRIDPATNQIIATIHAPGPEPTGITVGPDGVWFSQSGDVNGSPDGHTVARIDPSSDRIVQRVSVGLLPASLTFDGTDLFVSNHHSGTLTKIDTRSGRTTTIPLVTVNGVVTPRGVVLRSGPDGIATVGDTVWSEIAVAGAVVQINGRSGAVTRVIAPFADGSGICGYPSAQLDAVFVTSCGDQLALIDPSSGRVVRRPVLPVPSGGYLGEPVSDGAGGVWILAGHTLVRVDRQGAIQSRIPLPESFTQPGPMISADGSLWLIAYDTNDLYRVTP